MSSQRSFSNSFPRRLNPSSRSSFFRDFPIDDEDMFFESNPNWDFPPSGQLGGSIFDTFPRRSTMRSFPSHHFESTSSGSHDPFASRWHHPSWVEDEMRRSRNSSPSATDRMDSRRSPTPPNPSSSGPRSGSGSPGVGSQSFFGRNDGFPIKVVHEGTSRTPSRSSTPSSGAGEASHEASCESPTVPPPGVEKFPGVTSKVHSNAYSARRQPKVHHIPIHVEPRDDGQPPSRATPPPSNTEPRVGPNGDSASPCASPRQHRKAHQSQPAKKPGVPRVIPVQMDNSKCQTPPPPSDRLPTPEQQDRAPSPAPPRKAALTPFEVIEGVLQAVHEMETRVAEFSGTRTNKEYLFLDEMLTRNLIKLDNIETDGNADLRQTRKAAIQEVNTLIHTLEANVIKPPSESMEKMDTDVSEESAVVAANEEPMESDSSAPPSVEKGEAIETVVEDNSLKTSPQVQSSTNENCDLATAETNVSEASVTAAADTELSSAEAAASEVVSDLAEPSLAQVAPLQEAIEPPVDSCTESTDKQEPEREGKAVFKTTVELQVAGDCTASLPNGDATSEELMQAST